MRDAVWAAYRAEGVNPIYPIIEAGFRESYRTMTMRYVREHPWLELACNLGMGLPVDHETSEWEEMFLPIPFYKRLGSTFIDDDLAVKQERWLLGEPRDLLTMYGEYGPRQRSLLPAWIVLSITLLWGLITLLALYPAWRTGSSTIYPAPRWVRLIVWLDVFLFAALGLGGCVLILMMSSEHIATRWNLNILWAVPTHLVAAAALAWVLLRKQATLPRWLRRVPRCHRHCDVPPVVGLVVPTPASAAGGVAATPAGRPPQHLAGHRGHPARGVADPRIGFITRIGSSRRGDG